MKREWKKKLKSLKREKKKKADKLKPQNRYYPAIYCVKERLFIAWSEARIPVVGGRVIYRVNWRHWTNDITHWREDKYIISMAKYSVGDVVKCPHCGHSVDFRLWLSCEKPKFMEISNDQETNIKELPNT